MTLPGTDLPARGSKPWYSTFVSAWDNLRNYVKGHEDTLAGRLSAQGITDSFNSAFGPALDRYVWMAQDHGLVHQPDDATTGQHTLLNAIVSQLSAAGGGRLVIPRGMTIVLRGALTGANNVTIWLEPGARLFNNSPTSSLFTNMIGVENFSIKSESKTGIVEVGPKELPGTSPMTTPVKSLRFTNCRNITIDNVKMVNLAGRVIDLRGTSAGSTINGDVVVGCRDISIINNAFDTASDTLIEARDGSTSAPTIGLLIQNNIFKGLRKVAEKNEDGSEPTWSIVYLSRTQKFKILDNDFLSSADTAIMLGNGCQVFEIAGNVIRTTQVCIYLGSLRMGRIHDNDIQSDNDMGIHYYYTGGDFSDGILKINGNIIHDCAKPGILVEGGNNVIISDNQIDGCCIRANDFADVYKGAISIQSANGNAPDTVVISDNIVNKGAVVASTLYGVSVIGSPTNLTVADNLVVGSGYTNRFRYSTIIAGSMWSVQRDTTSDTTNKRTVVPSYDNLNSKGPTAGGMCVHSTLGVLYANDTTTWRKASDGTAVSPT